MLNHQPTQKLKQLFPEVSKYDLLIEHLQKGCGMSIDQAVSIGLIEEKSQK